MRKLLLAVAPAAALALGGCGVESKSCQTQPATLTSLAAGCTLAPNSNVSVLVQARCESCSHTQPSCVGETVGGVVELNPVFQDCEEDRGCSNTGSCPFGAFPCTFRTPATGSSVTVQFPSTAPGGLTTIQLPVASGGQTSCSVALTAAPTL
jgi:hypothetical protein